MELVGVRIELPTNQPIVLLREAGGLRYLPIWIGATEATAIAFALEGVEPQRPLTHDLLRDAIAGLEATIDRVVVNDLREGIYNADLVLAGEGGEVVISARPSDAIALAARTEASLFASEEVLNEAGVEIKEDDDEEAEVERFKEFLDTVQPEDFTGGS
ncbi:MAG: bifunctional nuclease family protein [Acidimicrobiia bacterium]|nr:bifunctional nuclease family protein [Acidimicrobiia bacterium]